MSKELCILYDKQFLKHKAETYHPERPERLSSVLEYLKENKISADFLEPVEADKDQICAAHTEKYYDHVLNTLKNGKGMLDADTFFNEESLKAALLAAGSVVKAVDLVVNKEYKNAFCLVRPPGHHAESSRAMGFCIFNNIAVGARYAIDKYKLKRVAIVDWDVHHGNGTQDIFYNDSSVLFISIHQHPLYPGTGMKIETGHGEGNSFTLNYPLPPGTQGKTYISLFEQEIISRLNEFNPEILFISAGFDAHIDDPLAGMELTTDDFEKLTSILTDFAKSKNISVISVLEGGYNLNALSESVYKHLKVLSA